MNPTERGERTWKKFHKRKEIDWAKRIALKKKFPTEWGCVGPCVTTYYASDKWQDNRRNFERYYHDHDKSTMFWLPAGTFPGLDTSQTLPKDVARKPGAGEAVEVVDLGLALGFDVFNQSTGKKGKFAPQHGAHLVCSPNGHWLYVLEDGAVVALIWGPSLRVEERGIVG
jgi:hypothetical protein